ncbi:MAG: polysaccharide deacetylase family protein [Terriglobales bacterium]
MRFVTPVLKHVVFPALSKSGYLRHSANAGPVVVTYHGVFPAGYKIRNSALDGNLVHADSLRRQLQLLKKRYHLISPEDFRQWCVQVSPGGKYPAEQPSLPPHSILLTCDDALRNTLTEMVPILQELGLTCLFFATGASADETPSMLWYEELYLMLLEARGPVTLSLPDANLFIGPIAPSDKHVGWWNLVEKLSPFDRESRRGFLDQICAKLKLPAGWQNRFIQNPNLAARFLTLDAVGLRQLAAAGMTIGAHSLSHPILARTSDELAWREISESRIILEKSLAQTVWAFGYPFGNPATVTRRDAQLAAQAGFDCAFMNAAGLLGARFNRFALPRVHITADMNLSEFEAHISGFYHLLRRRLLGGDERNTTTDAPAS